VAWGNKTPTNVTTARLLNSPALAVYEELKGLGADTDAYMWRDDTENDESAVGGEFELLHQLRIAFCNRNVILPFALIAGNFLLRTFHELLRKFIGGCERNAWLPLASKLRSGNRIRGLIELVKKQLANLGSGLDHNGNFADIRQLKRQTSRESRMHPRRGLDDQSSAAPRRFASNHTRQCLRHAQPFKSDR
jgi:hypothetical protein